MNSEDAFEFINGLILEKTKISLDESENKVFLGIWEDKTYLVIAEQIHLSEQSVKEIGSRLFSKINESFGINIKKRNFKPTIEQIYRQYVSQQDRDVIQREDIITNPFIPQQGRVENLQLFFGREREIRRIFEVLNSGSSVALIGEKGIGKSSLLWATCQQAQNFFTSACKTVFLDLNLIHDEDEFYTALCDEIGIPESKGYRLTRNLRGFRIVLATDNVGNVTSKSFSRPVFDQLRGLAEGSNAPLRLILAAREPLDQLFKDIHNQSKTSPLVGICQEENIKPWNEETARAFITSRLIMTSVSFKEEEIKKILQESGGHPQRLMQLCYQTYAQYIEAMQ